MAIDVSKRYGQKNREGIDVSSRFRYSDEDIQRIIQNTELKNALAKKKRLDQLQESIKQSSEQYKPQQTTWGITKETIKGLPDAFGKVAEATSGRFGSFIGSSIRKGYETGKTDGLTAALKRTASELIEPSRKFLAENVAPTTSQLFYEEGFAGKEYSQARSDQVRINQINQNVDKIQGLLSQLKQANAPETIKGIERQIKTLQGINADLASETGEKAKDRTLKQQMAMGVGAGLETFGTAATSLVGGGAVKAGLTGLQKTLQTAGILAKSGALSGAELAAYGAATDYAEKGDWESAKAEAKKLGAIGVLAGVGIPAAAMGASAAVKASERRILQKQTAKQEAEMLAQKEAKDLADAEMAKQTAEAERKANLKPRIYDEQGKPDLKGIEDFREVLEDKGIQMTRVENNILDRAVAGEEITESQGKILMKLEQKYKSGKPEDIIGELKRVEAEKLAKKTTRQPIKKLEPKVEDYTPETDLKKLDINKAPEAYLDYQDLQGKADLTFAEKKKLANYKQFFDNLDPEDIKRIETKTKEQISGVSDKESFLSKFEDATEAESGLSRYRETLMKLSKKDRIAVRETDELGAMKILNKRGIDAKSLFSDARIKDGSENDVKQAFDEMLGKDKAFMDAAEARAYKEAKAQANAPIIRKGAIEDINAEIDLNRNVDELTPDEMKREMEFIERLDEPTDAQDKRYGELVDRIKGEGKTKSQAFRASAEKYGITPEDVQNYGVKKDIQKTLEKSPEELRRIALGIDKLPEGSSLEVVRRIAADKLFKEGKIEEAETIARMSDKFASRAGQELGARGHVMQELGEASYATSELMKSKATAAGVDIDKAMENLKDEIKKFVSDTGQYDIRTVVKEITCKV